MTASAEHSTVGYGFRGNVQILQAMARAANQGVTLPLVVEQAHSIVQFVRSRDDSAMAYAIRHWMESVFKFIRDPAGVELLRTPEYMLRQFQNYSWISGDCDDAAILAAALGKSVGIPASFIAVGFSGDSLSHVFTVLQPRHGHGVSMDVTRPAGAVVQVRRRVVFRV
jgi:transglutaminase-like putative cysteine protease